MKTEYMLLALYNKPFLNFDETCQAIGISLKYGYNLRANKLFPIPMSESPLRASVQDVAEHIDFLRETAKEKMKS